MPSIVVVGRRPRDRGAEELQRLLTQGPLERLLTEVANRKSRQARARRLQRRPTREPKTIQEAWQKEARTPARPARTPPTRDTGIADSWARWQRRVPGIAGPLGGNTGVVDSAEVIFGALQQRATDRYLARRELGQNFPSDPGPRGRARTSAGAAPGAVPSPPTQTQRAPAPPGDTRGKSTATPKAAGPAVPPVVAPGVPSAKPDTPSKPAGNPLPGVSNTPRPGAIAYPSSKPQTVAGPSVRVGASPWALPELGPQPRQLRQRQVSRQDARPRSQSEPLTRFNSLGVPSVPTNGQDCECAKPKKPRKQSCTNPIISREQRGDILTIRRRIKCPQSRKK